MDRSKKNGYPTTTEAEIKPVLELLQGGDPDDIARRAGITREKLFQMRDNLLSEVESKKREQTHPPAGRIGRNDLCPCGSGKKYKHCCLDKHSSEIRQDTADDDVESLRARAAEKEKLIDQIEKTFQLLAAGRFSKTEQTALKLLKTYPNEDRLHDILANSYLYEGRCEEAIEICRSRLETARSEKDYFILHGRYRDAEIDEPALSYYYPPMTWLQKHWIALKTRDYLSRYPEEQNPEIAGLINILKTADDPKKFPLKQSEGLAVRKQELKNTLDRLKSIGREAIPYLLPLTCKYSWTGILATDSLTTFETESVIRALIDISMFGFAYASGASLSRLEQFGTLVIPHIAQAFTRDREFDPIKTGIVSILGNVRHPDSYALLLRLLDHESAHIVNWAGAAIGKFNDIRALPAMTAASKRIGGEKMIDDAIQRLESF